MTAAPVAFLSDIHGNSAALRAVLRDIQNRRVSETYCLGDLVGYGPDPNGVIDMVGEAGIPTIRGNYDDGIGFERDGCGCYYPDAEAQRIGEKSFEFTARRTTPERKAWLRGLPRELEITFAGRSARLVHGSPRRINEYLLPDRGEQTYRRLAKLVREDILVFGHTHVPWQRTYDGVLFVNVGSVGRPKDGDPRASYTILTLGPDESPASLVVRVKYDVTETVDDVRTAGLPEELARSFAEGR